MPVFHQDSGEENGPAAAPAPNPELIVELKFVPVTFRSGLLSKEGGITMSQSALEYVVRKWPPASSVSSNS